jgi:hypothetical protein
VGEGRVQCRSSRGCHRLEVLCGHLNALHKHNLIASMRRPHTHRCLCNQVRHASRFPRRDRLARADASADAVGSDCLPLARRSCTFCESLFPILARSLRARL